MNERLKNESLKDVLRQLVAQGVRWAVLALAVAVAGSAWAANAPTATVSGTSVTISNESGAESWDNASIGDMTYYQGKNFTVPAIGTDLPSGTILKITSVSVAKSTSLTYMPDKLGLSGCVSAYRTVTTRGFTSASADKYTYSFADTDCLIKVGTATPIRFYRDSGEDYAAPMAFRLGYNAYQFIASIVWSSKVPIIEIQAEIVSGFVNSTSGSGQSDWGFESGSGSGKVYLSGYGNYLKTPGSNGKEIVLVDGTYGYGLKIINGNSTSASGNVNGTIITKLSGTGTLTTDYNGNSGVKSVIQVYDSSDFSGAIQTDYSDGPKASIVFRNSGETLPDSLYNLVVATTPAQIYVSAGKTGANAVTIPAGKTWKASKLVNRGELIVAGSFDGPIENTGTIKYTDSTLTSITIGNNNGTIDLSALTALESVTFNVTTARSVGTIVWPTGFSGTVSVIICDDSETTGTIAFDTTGLPANTTYRFQHADGVEIKHTLSVSGTIRTYTYTPTTGKACWMDYEFDGDLDNVGTDTTSLFYDIKTGSQTLHTAADSFSDGKLLTYTHPWRNVSSYPDTWSAVIRANVLAGDNAPLLMFGSTTSGSKGLIGLVTVPGDVDELTEEKTYNKVALATWKEGTTGYTTNSLMTVANATTAQHVYAFTKSVADDTTIINVYCDGELITKYTTTDTVVFGAGLQFGGSHGGGDPDITGFVRFSDDGDSKIDFVRLYQKDLSLAANNAILTQTVADYPYISSVGLYERNLDGTGADWKEDSTWSKASDSSTVATPPANAMVKLTASADTAVTLKNDATYSYERLTFDGAGAITLKKGTYTVSDVEHDTHKVSAASVVVNTDTTVEYGAVDFSGSRISVQSGKTLTFDLSSGYDFTSINRTTTFQLTGYVAAYEPGAVAITGAPPNGFYTLSVAYNTSKSYYEATITPATVTLTHGGVSQNYDVITNAFADADAGDTITVNLSEMVDALTVDKSVTLALDASVTVGTLNVASNLTVTGTGTLSASAVTVSGDATIKGYDLANATVTVTSGSLIAVPAPSYTLGTDTVVDTGYTTGVKFINVAQAAASVTTGGTTNYYAAIQAAVIAMLETTGETDTLELLNGTTLDPMYQTAFTGNGFYYDGSATVTKAVATYNNRTYGSLATAVAAANEAGTTAAVTLKRASSESVSLNVDVTITEVSAGLYTGTLSGSGTFVLAATRESAMSFGNWTGTVILPAVTYTDYLNYNGFNFNFYGVLGSTVTLSDGLPRGAWLTNAAVNPAVEIPAEKTLSLVSFSPSFANTFAVLKGEGAFDITATANDDNDLANVANWGASQNYSAYFRLGDVSEFTGSLTTTSHVGIALGASKPGKNTVGGKIYVYTTVTASDDWTAPNGIVLADANATLTVATGATVTTDPAVSTTVADSYVEEANGVYSVETYKTVTITGSHATWGRTDDLGTFIKKGDSVTFTVTSDYGYKVDSVTVDGEQLSVSGDTYTFVVAGDATVEVSTSVKEHAEVVSTNVTTIISVPVNCRANELVVTTNRAEGDGLKVYNPGSKSYYSWTYDGKGSWYPNPVHVVTGEDTSSSVPTPQASKVPLKKGQAVLLTRGDPSKEIVLCEGYSTDPVDVSVVKGEWNLIAPVPKAGQDTVLLNDAVGEGAADDVIKIPTAGAPLTCFYDSTKGTWGYWKVKTNGSGRITDKTFETNVTLDAGTGFWYVSGETTGSVLLK